MKTTSGLLKLLYPDGRLTDQELEEVLLLSSELRQRVREQLHLIAPGEYERIHLGMRILPSGKQIGSTLPEAGRVQKVSLPQAPAVGEVIGLGVTGDQGIHGRLTAPVKRVVSPNTPVPFSPPMENFYRPDAHRIVSAVRGLIGSA